MIVKSMKSRLVRKIFSRFYFPITNHFEEWMYGDAKIGRRRKVDITELSCSHIYWQEKEGNLDERFCDVCFQVWLMSMFVDEHRGKRVAEEWDRRLRKRVIGE